MQELTAHLADGAYRGAEVHFIGHLQTNKVKYVVGKVALIHSVSSEKLLQAIAAQADKLGLVQNILHHFMTLRQLAVDIRQEMVDNNRDMDMLSMGMSGDYKDAVAAGSTCVRVGSALFGPRPPVLPEG